MTEEQLHQMMVGRARSEFLYHENEQTASRSSTPALQVRGLSQSRAFENVTLEVRPGEIVGIAGVIGSGKSELGRAIFGAGKGVTGDVLVGGRPVQTISEATRSGVGYVPQDRAGEGALLPQPVSWNISLARMSAQGATGAILDRRREKRDATEYVDLLKIKTPSIQTALGRLSGGNQQKVILSRWLAADTKVLILDNPTRGVYVGAKENIYSQLREQVAAGLAVVLISDDLNELIMMSSRIHIMSGGHVRATIETPPESKPTEVELVADMV